MNIYIESTTNLITSLRMLISRVCPDWCSHYSRQLGGGGGGGGGGGAPAIMKMKVCGLSFGSSPLRAAGRPGTETYKWFD